MPGQKPNGSSTTAAHPGGVTHAGFAHDSRYVYWAGGYISDAAGTGQTFGTNEVWRYDTQANTYTKLANLPKRTDRKSTRLNSSHANISYAVFCLKKKKKLQSHNTSAYV